MAHYTLDHLLDYLREGWVKSSTSPYATAEQKVAGALKGTLLKYYNDHGLAAFRDYVTDYNRTLHSLHQSPSPSPDVKEAVIYEIPTTEVVLSRLRLL